MSEEPDLFKDLCSYENLERAFAKARRGKTTKQYVLEFENELENNLRKLQGELIFHTYKPMPLKTFILRDPKTRKISKSDFRDRVMHHALCNLIEPLFEKGFIYDSYANRLGKGTLNAIKRFDYFKRKVSKNNSKICFVLKADIKHYFETVDHNILLSIIKNKIIDKKILWLIKIILKNHKTTVKNKGMPLGNLTSQFFANIYLNELDRFVKHELKAKYYLRYVDDFIILETSKQKQELYKEKINDFLQKKLVLTLHPQKSKILKLSKGIGFLGFRIFCHHKLIKKKNLRKFERKLNEMRKLYKKDQIEREKVVEKFEGWAAYTMHGNTYKYRRHITRLFNQYFPFKKSTNITNIKKHQNFTRKEYISKTQFTTQKTLQLFKKKLTIKEIAEKRNLKISTIWQHLAELIEHNQIPLKLVISKDKIQKILPYVQNCNDKLQNIKNRIKDPTITYDAINCILSHLKSKNANNNIFYLIRWYQQINCKRKCYKPQQFICNKKFKLLASQSSKLQMNKKEFLYLFNNHLKICILPKREKKRLVTWEEFNKRMQTIKKK
ncbi:reverse transcriptase domain-containing protein [Nanoarchaeota archaeon]